MPLFATRDAKVCLVTLTGEIDIENAAKHEQQLRHAIDDTPRGTVIADCSHLTFVDGRGLAMMYRVSQYASALYTTVHWTGLSDYQHRLIELTGLNEVLTVEANDNHAQ